jgi:hypothetical protein
MYNAPVQTLHVSLDDMQSKANAIGPSYPSKLSPKYVAVETSIELNHQRQSCPEDGHGSRCRWPGGRRKLRKPKGSSRNPHGICVSCNIDTGSYDLWKPRTLQAPILGGVVLFSICMIIVLEVLSHISSGNGNENGGGVAFSADSEDVSTLATFR